METTNILTAIIGPVITGIFGFWLAGYKIKKSLEKRAYDTINRMADELLVEFKNDIQELKRENNALKKQLVEAKDRIKNLDNQIEVYKDMVRTMENELGTLRSALKFYELQIDKVNTCPHIVEQSLTERP